MGLAGTYGFSALADDGQRLFALNFDGVLTSSGEHRSRGLVGAAARAVRVHCSAERYDGVVYPGGAGSGGTVYAVSEADGVVRWTQGVANGDKSSPAVDSSGVYVSYACQQDYSFSPSGRLRWHYSTSCEGGGDSIAALHAGDAYMRGAYDTRIVLAKATEASPGSFSSTTAPAFGGTKMYTLQNGDLVAVDASGSPDLWTYGDETLVTSPVVSDVAVFAGSDSGAVYAVSASSGTEVWSCNAGASILGPDEQNADVLVGMAVGGGMLVVPASNVLATCSD